MVLHTDWWGGAAGLSFNSAIPATTWTSSPPAFLGSLQSRCTGAAGETTGYPAAWGSGATRPPAQPPGEPRRGPRGHMSLPLSRSQVKERVRHTGIKQAHQIH